MGTKSCDRVGYKRVKKRSPRHSVQHKFYTSHIKWKSSSTFRLHSGVASESASRPVEVSIHRPPADSSSSIAILLLSVLMVYINSGSRTDIPTVSRNARAARFRFWPCPQSAPVSSYVLLARWKSGQVVLLCVRDRLSGTLFYWARCLSAYNGPPPSSTENHPPPLNNNDHILGVFDTIEHIDHGLRNAILVL